MDWGPQVIVLQFLPGWELSIGSSQGEDGNAFLFPLSLENWMLGLLPYLPPECNSCQLALMTAGLSSQ